MYEPKPESFHAMKTEMQLWKTANQTSRDVLQKLFKTIAIFFERHRSLDCDILFERDSLLILEMIFSTMIQEERKLVSSSLSENSMSRNTEKKDFRTLLMLTQKEKVNLPEK